MSCNWAGQPPERLERLEAQPTRDWTIMEHLAVWGIAIAAVFMIAAILAGQFFYVAALLWSSAFVVVARFGDRCFQRTRNKHDGGPRK